jgi:hypothetical protein
VVRLIFARFRELGSARQAFLSMWAQQVHFPRPSDRKRQELSVPRSEAGGERAAILYTVLETAKLNRLDPEVYLADVINRMTSGHPNNRLGELLRWNWQHEPAKLAA